MPQISKGKQISNYLSSIIEQLELGSNTALLVSRLIRVDFFHKRLLAADILSNDNIALLQKNQADRMTIIKAKSFLINLLKMLVTAFNQPDSKVLLGSQNYLKEIDSILDLLDGINIKKTDETAKNIDDADTDIIPDDYYGIIYDKRIDKLNKKVSESEKEKELQKKLDRILRDIKLEKKISELELCQLEFIYSAQRNEIFDLAHKEIDQEDIEYVFDIFSNKTIRILLLSNHLLSLEDYIINKYQVKHIKFFDLESINRRLEL